MNVQYFNDAWISRAEQHVANAWDSGNPASARIFRAAVAAIAAAVLTIGYASVVSHGRPQPAWGMAALGLLAVAVALFEISSRLSAKAFKSLPDERRARLQTIAGAARKASLHNDKCDHAKGLMLKRGAKPTESALQASYQALLPTIQQAEKCLEIETA